MSAEKAMVLRKMARYIRKNGFSPVVGNPGQAQCFIGAKNEVGGTFCISDCALRTEMDIWCSATTLEQEGWNTKDAAAACEIAADLES